MPNNRMGIFSPHVDLMPLSMLVTMLFTSASLTMIWKILCEWKLIPLRYLCILRRRSLRLYGKRLGIFVCGKWFTFSDLIIADLVQHHQSSIERERKHLALNVSVYIF